MTRNAVIRLVTALIFLGHLLPAQAAGEKRIGVLLWSEEPRYSQARDGLMEQLRKGGFGESAARCTVENAGGNKAKAAELARKFAGEKLDLIVPVGTSAAIAVAREVKDVPVVFNLVYDPVESKIVRDWRRSGNNLTGASAKVPISKLARCLKEFATVRKLAVLYTPGEKNSELQLKELEGLQADARIKVIPVPLGKKEDADQLLPEVIRTVDAVYLSGSSIVGQTSKMIVDMATRAKVVTVTHLDDLVSGGVLLGVCADPHAVGRQAGEMAVKVLRGAKPSSIPIGTPNKLEVIVNMRTLRAGQYRMPPSFMRSVTKTVE
jgi:putative ABC transport system substrate-binding protein